MSWLTVIKMCMMNKNIVSTSSFVGQQDICTRSFEPGIVKDGEPLYLESKGCCSWCVTIIEQAFSIIHDQIAWHSPKNSIVLDIVLQSEEKASSVLSSLTRIAYGTKIHASNAPHDNLITPQCIKLTRLWGLVPLKTTETINSNIPFSEWNESNCKLQWLDWPETQ